MEHTAFLFFSVFSFNKVGGTRKSTLSSYGCCTWIFAYEIKEVILMYEKNRKTAFKPWFVYKKTRTQGILNLLSMCEKKNYISDIIW